MVTDKDHGFDEKVVMDRLHKINTCLSRSQQQDKRGQEMLTERESTGQQMSMEGEHRTA
ncbi:hypothetical protein QJS10_CPB11g01602 [Acorus calamus]|uniref:Uncharacterized protein n=1 Tax=Acorus calamus TaxID=4465 RepID=A0AAV9DU53_ACOCL|nr:hypothetical protein QJS10_CPB11g01602 [Acorus calamus]